MSGPGESHIRTALQVTAARIAAMGENELNALMEMLLEAQARKCGSPLNQIIVNTEEKASDDGCDGWSGKPEKPDDWLGLDETCWQFKSGSAGQPAELRGEILKKIPKDTLTKGGRFVIVASGSTRGVPGEQARLEVLVNDAQAAGIPFIKVDVIGSERLSRWCNQHPAVAAHWSRRPAGLWTFEDWSNSDEHRDPWQSTPGESEFDRLRADLNFGTGNVLHLHLQGQPGVGKTRFALELCRGAAWKSEVIYIRQVSDFRLSELIDSVVADGGVQLVVVADEAQFQQLQPLRDSVGRGNGRIRLITIGHCSSPDPTRIYPILIKPLERQAMRGVIKGWHPAMPQEHVDFVTTFADGYVRLARLASNAVALSPSMDVRGLLKRDEIRGFFNRMLGTNDRRALHVVAVLTSVGWTGEVQCEGEAIARHLGQDWDSVRAEVEHFHNLFGIVPRGGRYRYISPTPLGIHLAVEAWEIYPDRLQSLPTVLPSEAAVDAYYGRLKSIASNPNVREFAREQLAFFFQVDHFIEANAVRRWAALSSADPAQAAQNVLKALSNSNIEDRERIEGAARRQLVWALVRLAWNQSSFHYAVTALALLAEAENETWANNASAEFVIRFNIALGGTAVPFLHRLEVLDTLIATKRESLLRLAVSALAQVTQLDAVRVASDPISDEVPEREWRPRSDKEYFDCVAAAMNRLVAIAKQGMPDIQDHLVSVATDMAPTLRQEGFRTLVANFLDAVREAYQSAREPIRRAIAEIINYERSYWKTLSPQELETLQQLYRRFEDTSLGARLQQQVAQAPLDPDAQIDLKPLASELYSDLDALAQNWPWLTSGDAADGWRLGQALAEVDPEARLANKLPQLTGSGNDLRVISGYISFQRKALGDEWYEAWLTSQSNRVPKPVDLLIDVAWRSGPNSAAALILSEILRQEKVNPAVLGHLAYGAWGQGLSAEVLERLLQAMSQTVGHAGTAIGMLVNRINANPDELGRWKPLCLKLVLTPELIRGQQMASFFWSGAARRLIPEHAREIAAAILEQHQNKDSGRPWLIAHSEAEKVLKACADSNPSDTWQAVQRHLSSPVEAEIFSIGFPSHILSTVPVDEMRTWIAERPGERAAIVAKFLGADFSNDSTAAAVILGEFGDDERTGNAFFNNYISGVHWGPISTRWDQLAESLDEVAARTSLPKLRRWAQKYAEALRRMGEEMRGREEEEELHRQ